MSTGSSSAPTDTGRPFGTWPPERLKGGPFCGPANQAEAVAFVRVRDEQRAVGAIGGTVHAWDIQTGQELGTGSSSPTPGSRAGGH